MPTIESITEDYELGEDDLCLTPTGWIDQKFTVLIQLQGGMTLEQALEALWQQHQGILGSGTLYFKCLERDPRPRGYIVFTPDPGA